MKARKTLMSMLAKRGYSTDGAETFLDMTDDEYMTHKVRDTGDKIYLFSPQTKGKIGVTTIREYINKMKEQMAERAIVVVKDAITAFAKQVFVDERDMIFETFKENELLIDKLDHVLVPEHVLLDAEEKAELMKLYNLKDSQLPKIMMSDPIAMYFGARRGQVFKIYRKSESAGDYIYYRIVA